MDYLGLLSSIERVTIKIADHLASAQRVDGTYPARDFYGKSFSILLWNAFDDRYTRNITLALEAITNENKPKYGPETYHFEFNRFALKKIGFSEKSIDQKLGGFNFAGARVANWTLLRALCRLNRNSFHSTLIGHLELIFVLLWFQRSRGFIEDWRGSFTSQYHAFCITLLGELEQVVWPRFQSITRDTFVAGVQHLAELVLPGGNCNYIGRGALQIFGYAAAILAFSHSFRISKNHAHLFLLRDVLHYIESFQRVDGGIPLVLSPTRRREGSPEKVDLESSDFSGWYHYNNYFDYLPFTGALLVLSRKILQQELPKKLSEHSHVKEVFPKTKPNIVPIGNRILKISSDNYTAVICPPNRDLSASLPIPYLAVKKNYPLPCYGGNDRAPTPFSPADIPLPTFFKILPTRSDDLIFCDPDSYRWTSKNTMCGDWIGGRHYRTFSWRPSCFEIYDRVEFSKSCVDFDTVTCHIVRIFLPEILKVRICGSSIVSDVLRIETEGQLETEKFSRRSPDGSMRVYFLPIDVNKGAEICAKSVFHLSI